MKTTIKFGLECISIIGRFKNHVHNQGSLETDRTVTGIVSYCKQLNNIIKFHEKSINLSTCNFYTHVIYNIMNLAHCLGKIKNNNTITEK